MPDFDFDLTAGPSTTTRTEYVIASPRHGLIPLTEAGGADVEAGIIEGVAPLPLGERLWRREVTVTTTVWDAVNV